MRFWRSIPGAIVLVAVLGVIAGVGLAAAQIHRVTHPPRAADLAVNLGTALSKAEDVSFVSTDGVTLTGWLFRGKPRMPAVVIGHDLGASKVAMMNLAIAINDAGFTVLAFDFRGHGASSGDGSTLGVWEGRDVLGAVDFVADLPDKDVDARRIGIFGVGMGAHAAVVAASERPALRVMVLDGLWPDAGFTLMRRTFADWPWAEKHLGAVPVFLFPWIAGPSIDDARAESILTVLAGRDLLLIAPAGDGRLDHAMREMYQVLPEQRDSERNLVTLPATWASGLGTDELNGYQQRVVEFFRSRLQRSQLAQ